MTRSLSDGTSPICIRFLRTSDYRSELFSEEYQAIQNALPVRFREYSTGRHCARMALMGMGFPPVAITSDHQRVPIWPSDVVGSISHTKDVAVAAIGSSEHFHAIGVDIERSEIRDQKLHTRIVSPIELETRPNDLPIAQFVALAFSAKEAYYKAIFPQYRIFLDFHDLNVRIRIQPDGRRGSFTVQSVIPHLPSIRGDWVAKKRHILSLVAIAREK